MIFRALVQMGFALALSLAVATDLRADERRLVVFAAASLKGALDTALEGWTGAPVIVSYGGSAAQARQIALGAPADLVILAHDDWMEWLHGQDVLQHGSDRVLLGNRLVLVAPSNAPEAKVTPAMILQQLGPAGRLAMGQRDAVPAGQYARQWLETAGLWAQLSSRLAETENVRAALALVALRETPLGVVYASDASAEPDVRIVYRVPSETHAPIRYPAALTQVAPGTANALLDWLSAPEAQAVFADHGFVPFSQLDQGS